MSTDQTFITNENGQSLEDRFKVLIKNSKLFDCLVGYFYVSGFHLLYKSLESTEKIRILIGINTDKKVYDLLKTSSTFGIQSELQFSTVETKEHVEKLVTKEFEDSDDGKNIEEGILKFVEWIKSGKLEIRAYPSQNIHAKLYIMTFKEGGVDDGRVVTGSSNFTISGLRDNIEFNVELKNRSDYEFAKNKFNELWKESVDVTEKYVETIKNKTWINQNISPYQLYLKFLYEYFKDELNQTNDVFLNYVPEKFKKLEYQRQAVLNAKKILEEHGGVFISDVVGLGKTYIATMLANQLDGRTLVIAPPALLDEDNPGSWPNAFSDMKVPADFESRGKLEKIIKRGVEKYKNIIIDEAHTFRTETNKTYEMISEICRGKRVILVTATPYNNSPKDILSQIKLFQKVRKSTIPNLQNLEGFFNKLQEKIKKIDREENYADYIKAVKENAKEIREKVLKYLMVRRTRSEISKYFSEDLKKQKIKFPEIEDPKPLFYELSEKEDEIFTKTIKIISKEFKYARYTPMLYYKGKITLLEETSQKNMGKFMKILLVKRLESSFFAFKKSIDRFVRSYEMFIDEFKRGNVYVSKKYTNKIFDLIENGDDLAIQKLISEDKAKKYNSDKFNEKFISDLESDYNSLRKVQDMWKDINDDPKLTMFIKELSQNSILKKNKLVIFTESKETAEYLERKLNEKFPHSTLCFTGQSNKKIRDEVIENFDANAHYQKNDFRMLVATDVLSEGVNLHRSNIVINYDIPWNPTRMMQRVGRVNRINTKFDKIYTFNFFPTKQSNDQIRLKEVAESKINAFLTLLGGDAMLLTEGEPIGSYELFNRLTSKKTLTGESEEEESELKYLKVIKDVRDKNPKLFEKIKKLPKKSRTSKLTNNEEHENSLLTYFRKGKLQKFFIANVSGEAKELDFTSAASLLESNVREKRQELPENFYELLDKNKEAFNFATSEDQELMNRHGSNNERKLLKILKFTLKNAERFTDERESFLEKLLKQVEEGGIPKNTIKETLKALNELNEDLGNPFRVLSTIERKISPAFLEKYYSESNSTFSGKREVILSMYLKGE